MWRKIFGPKKEKDANYVMNILIVHTANLMLMKSRMMRLIIHVGEIRNVCRSLTVNFHEKKPLARTVHKLCDNINVDLREIE